MNYYMDVLKKYAVFNGRAGRAEYWYFVLFNFIVTIVINIVGYLLLRGNGNVLGALYGLAVFIPSLAVFVRRLHDTDRSGWWILIGLIPIIGTIWLIVLLILEGTPGDNRYGPNPKGAANVSPINV
jgi:uncharacterized membrane protein YhaH (DUF805 family)